VIAVRTDGSAALGRGEFALDKQRMLGVWGER
jgi:hypothetical protein